MTFPTASLGKIFSTLHWQTRIFVEKRLADTGLTWGEFHIIMRLYRDHEITQTELTHTMYITKATTSKMLTKLERDGYVTRKRLPHDHRTFSIRPTQKALILQQHLFTISRRWNDSLLTSFSGDEQTFLISALTKLADQAVQVNASEMP